MKKIFTLLTLSLFSFSFVSAQITSNLSMGSKGEQVKELQKFLKIEETGTFGRKTKIALINYQKLNGIKGTGTTGPATRNLISLKSISKVVTDNISESNFNYKVIDRINMLDSYAQTIKDGFININKDLDARKVFYSGFISLIGSPLDSPNYNSTDLLIKALVTTNLIIDKDKVNYEKIISNISTIQNSFNNDKLEFKKITLDYDQSLSNMNKYSDHEKALKTYSDYQLTEISKQLAKNKDFDEILPKYISSMEKELQYIKDNTTSKAKVDLLLNYTYIPPKTTYCNSSYVGYNTVSTSCTQY